MANNQNPVSEIQRVTLISAYLRELEEICQTQYGGDFDKMPPKVKVNWTSVVKRAGVRGVTESSASKLVLWAGDHFWDQAA
ncbi:MAG TPA: hypothetical protein VIE65_04185 [Methylobacter sp.]|jgi:hypothetical protein